MWLLFAALLVVLGWFWWPGSEPDSATTAALEAAAEEWWQPSRSDRTIPEDEWPAELRRLNPTNVRVTAEGVFISLRSFYVAEWGLFVLPHGSAFQPQSGTDPSFRLLRGRVYRYVIKG